ncbi:hypothetical protein JXA63_04020 [Candidatus Woesebacteria bacterium]|nr:hypothetical protein [Candidatus Woesebacteria bacterium]
MTRNIERPSGLEVSLRLLGAGVALAGCRRVTPAESPEKAALRDLNSRGKSGQEISRPPVESKSDIDEFNVIVTPLDLRDQYLQEEMLEAGVVEPYETKNGDVLYLDLIAKVYTPEQKKQRTLDYRSDPSLQGVVWAENADLRVYTTGEGAFYLPVTPVDEDGGVIVNERVPFPSDEIDDEELTKFTNGTYIFDLERRQWVRLNEEDKLEVYQIIEEKGEQPGHFTRVSEQWVTADGK